MWKLLLLCLPLAACGVTFPPGCGHVYVGTPEDELPRCYSSYVVNERVGPSGSIKVYDSNLPAPFPRYFFVENGAVAGWQER